MRTTALPLQQVLPVGCHVNELDHLVIGDCDSVRLAQEFGTPLYVYDELTIRTAVQEYMSGLGGAYPDWLVLYASKAFSSPALLRLMAEQGLGLDVATGGELYVAERAGFPMERVYFHGNNKSPDELDMALDLEVGRVVVDNMHELEVLGELATRRGRRATILLRVTPGVEAHTHEFIKTGILDTKFGLPIATGQAEAAVARATQLPGIELIGLHCHIGSQIFELEPYREALTAVIGFAVEQRQRHGLELRELSPGGGLGIAYTAADRPPERAEAARFIARAATELLDAAHLGRPRLVFEPGRSLVGRSALALYRVGAIKVIPGLRTYVGIDGGMSDNVRPVTYGARYDALLANRATEPAQETVTLAGKHCESGDLLIRDIALPHLEPGDLIAVPASGAYNLSMSSNYNHVPRPAVVLVKDGHARLIRRRQTYEDLLREEVY